MRFSPLKTSLVALALFAVPQAALASASAETGKIVVAQAQDERLDAIRKFLAGGRNLSKLPDNRLQQRLNRAQSLKLTNGLPADLASGLDQEIAEINAELSRRQQAGGNQDSGAAPAPAEAAQPDAQQPAPDSGSAQTQAQGNEDIAAFLRSAKQPSELNDSELRQQMRRAAQLAKSQGVTDQQRRELRQLMRDSRAEMQKRQGGNSQAQTGTEDSPPQNGQQSQDSPANSASAGDVTTFLAAAKPADQLDNAQLRQQMRKAVQLSRQQGITPEQRQRLRQIARESREEMQKRQQAGTTGNQQNQATNQTGTGTQDQSANAQGDAEKRAKALLAENVDVSTLDRQALRKRLTTMRDLLATNKLTPETSRALRQKLASERSVLRNQMGQAGAGTGGANNNNTDTSQSGGINGNNNTVNNTNVTINNNTRVVLNDRRPSRDLKRDELRRRINVYRDAINDNRFTERERREWREYLERDRVVLRERLIEDRRRRQQELRVGVGNGNIDFDLSLNFQPDRPPPPRSVFAAEADEEELEDILAAPPRRKIERRYTVDEVESNPDLRDAVARIEIDTVRFGFGEGFLREEEIFNLDRIAEIMERILAANPGEIFMIEGHTDAVGSDRDNLELSRERAKAVKEALATYYVIPEENLKTVGFGERYLKIPTSEPEAENRRVSIARITPLVGALDQ